MQRDRRLVLALAACVASGLSVGTVFAQEPAASGPEADPIKPAEQLIFIQDHFAGLKAPADLVYVYEKKGTLVPAHTEEIHVRLKHGDQGVLTAVVADANGETPLSVSAPMQGNPVIIYFLEKDISEMHRLTGGQPRYFQKRIRLALAAGPEVKVVKVQRGGKTVEGKEVVILPYADDPNHARFEKLVGKRYTFVLSEKVPGWVVSVTSEVAADGGGISEVESIRLKGVK